MVNLFLAKFSVECLKKGIQIPSPLIVGCWNAGKYAEETMDLLLEKLPEEEVRCPGPDGLNAVTILAKRGKWSTISKFIDKLGRSAVLEAAICFGNLELVDKLLGSQPPERALEWAMKSNNIEAMDKIREKYGSDQMEKYLISSQWDSPYCLIRKAARKSTTPEDSFLTELTKKFPVYNEATEEKPIFELSKSKSVSVEKDILVHARDPFCSLKTGNKHQSIFNIRKMNIPNSFTCQHG